ncbi:MAG TPA: hypothetical protein EYQ43_03330 [Methyloprofundus sp.]|nr:hypothetical protein [Methyloprofundus sp.]HIL78045.1 hypothetical protein [Methylococcales bacterium]
MPFITAHHSKLLLLKNTTYYWSKGVARQSDEGLIKNVDMWTLLKQSIEQEVQNKGYQHIENAGQADLNISFMALWNQAWAMLKLPDNTGSRYFCESLFWASQPKQAAKT